MLRGFLSSVFFTNRREDLQEKLCSRVGSSETSVIEFGLRCSYPAFFSLRPSSSPWFFVAPSGVMVLLRHAIRQVIFNIYQTINDDSIERVKALVDSAGRVKSLKGWSRQPQYLEMQGRVTEWARLQRTHEEYKGAAAEWLVEWYGWWNALVDNTHWELLVYA